MGGQRDNLLLGWLLGHLLLLKLFVLLLDEVGDQVLDVDEGVEVLELVELLGELAVLVEALVAKSVLGLLQDALELLLHLLH